MMARECGAGWKQQNGMLMEVADRIARVDAGFVRISVSGRFWRGDGHVGIGVEREEKASSCGKRDKRPTRRDKEERHKTMINIQTRQKNRFR